MRTTWSLRRRRMPLQRKANAIQAFCVIFGITFWESKLRRTISLWGPTEEVPPLLVGRPERRIVELMEGLTDYLGIPHDLDNSGMEAFNRVEVVAQAHCNGLYTRSLTDFFVRSVRHGYPTRGRYRVSGLGQGISQRHHSNLVEMHKLTPYNPEGLPGPPGSGGGHGEMTPT